MRLLRDLWATSPRRTALVAVLIVLGAAGQADVDQVFGARPTSAPVLPKGLTAQTANLVERALRSRLDGLSASECASVTELARVSARRYLEHFVATGRAEVRLRYGGTGRPERQYVWLGP